MIFPFTQPSLHFQCLAEMANPLFCSLRSLLLPQIKHGWKIPELNGGFVRWENHLWVIVHCHDSLPDSSHLSIGMYWV